MFRLLCVYRGHDSSLKVCVRWGDWVLVVQDVPRHVLHAMFYEFMSNYDAYTLDGYENKDYLLGFGEYELYEEESDKAVHYHIA